MQQGGQPSIQKDSEDLSDSFTWVRGNPVEVGFGELPLVYTLSGVPMQERLATEHASELVAEPISAVQLGSSTTHAHRLLAINTQLESGRAPFNHIERRKLIAPNPLCSFFAAFTAWSIVLSACPISSANKVQYKNTKA
ncbi:hypothetical protein ETB97_002779 [Aspergillus alliaceus]|uniref:Uncharacterized protein n=1 Tax=Petromyces alliaceus TaxID=209559 RepID=A0A8H5ZYX1_PETAA|nr:hypothetical protein ETB97_002779 [Aspergillus burnettii]